MQNCLHCEFEQNGLVSDAAGRLKLCLLHNLIGKIIHTKYVFRNISYINKLSKS